jgi:hypothetical protein
LTQFLGPVSFSAAPLSSAQIACTDHAEEPRPTLQENVMKRLAFVVAAVIAITACSKASNNADTAAPAMAPAPAPATTDTGMKMDTTKKDSSMMKMDTTKKDTSKMGGKKKG